MAEAQTTHPNWHLAAALLAAVKPGSRSFAPDDIAGLAPGVWEPFEVDDREPAEVNRALERFVDGRLRGLLVVVTWASYSPGTGPFFVMADQLPALRDQHAELFGEPFVSGDLVIVAPSVGRLVVVHHSGFIAMLVGVQTDLGHLAAG